MLAPYGRYRFAAVLTGYAIVLLIVGFSFYLSWQPWAVQCGGGYCGGSHVPPNPYLPQALFILLATLALMAGSWSVVMRSKWRSPSTSHRVIVTVASSLLLSIGAWLLFFVVEFWRNALWGDLWNASTEGVIQGIFFGSLVLGPAGAAIAGLLLQWGRHRGNSHTHRSQQLA